MPLPPLLADAGLTYASAVAALIEAATRLTDALARRRLNADPVQWRDAVADQAAQLLALQQTAVEEAEPFLTAALEAQGADPAADGTVNVAAFVDQTDGGGSWMRNLIYAPPSAYRAAIAVGAGDTSARSRARFVANSIVTSAMQDIPRSAVSTGMLARRQVKGYVRVLRGVSCARCVILAGRQYYVSAFARHPLCDCYHVPVAEDAPGDWTTDPKAYFNSLTAAEQDAIFGEAGAEAIRLGADMNQVVNAAKGVTTVNAYGRDVRATTEGITVRGIAGQRLAAEGLRKTARYRGALTPRLMPDEIFLLAEQGGWTREETLRQLRRFAYIV